MSTICPPRRHAALLLGAWLLAGSAAAHEFSAGKVSVDHPYATPTPAGATTGAVYFRYLHNTGDTPDRLLGARSPAARSVEIHAMQMDGDVMRMRALPALDLPPRTEMPARHSGRYHLMLIDLKQPLKNGDRFPVTLDFERGGSTEVMVWVQQPRQRQDGSGAQHAH